VGQQTWKIQRRSPAPLLLSGRFPFIATAIASLPAQSCLIDGAAILRRKRARSFRPAPGLSATVVGISWVEG